MIRLNDGHDIPAVGFGVFMIPNDGPTYDAVLQALKIGYRHIDTAAAYFNESDVGKAIRDSGIPRSEIFITSKLWLQDYGYAPAKKGIEASLHKLGTDYIDLYLLHQPYGDVAGAWKALEEAKAEGKLRSIGVSNMTPKIWKTFVPQFSTLPAVNQVECHPFFQQRELRELLAENDVKIEAYQPLGHGDPKLLAHPTVTKLAERYQKDPGQIILRFEVQDRLIVLPKSNRTSMCVLVLLLIPVMIKTTRRMDQIRLIKKGDMIMSKNLGVKPYLFPMPTYMIGTYNEDDSVDVMMMAWGGICAEDMVALNLEAEHKTVVNLEARKAFTLAVPGKETMRESDFLGIASANKMADKFERTGLHAVKSERVYAPVITEYPLTLECEVVEMQSQPYGLRVLGKIVNVIADEKILDDNGKIDAGKLNAFVFDQMQNGYYAIGEKIGQAWHSGADLMRK